MAANLTLEKGFADKLNSLRKMDRCDSKYDKYDQKYWRTDTLFLIFSLISFVTYLICFSHTFNMPVKILSVIPFPPGLWIEHNSLYTFMLTVIRAYEHFYYYNDGSKNIEF